MARLLFAGQLKVEQKVEQKGGGGGDKGAKGSKKGTHGRKGKAAAAAGSPSDDPIEILEEEEVGCSMLRCAGWRPSHGSLAVAAGQDTRSSLAWQQGT